MSELKCTKHRRFSSGVYCIDCGKKIGEDQSEPVDIVDFDPDETHLLCSGCNNHIRYRDNYCSYCGKKQEWKSDTSKIADDGSIRGSMYASEKYLRFYDMKIICPSSPKPHDFTFPGYYLPVNIISELIRNGTLEMPSGNFFYFIINWSGRWLADNANKSILYIRKKYILKEYPDY